MSNLYDIMWKEQPYRTERKITKEEINAIHGLKFSVAQVIFGKNLEEVIKYSNKLI